MTTYEHLSLIAVYLSLLASYGGLALICYGIRTMDKNAAMRAADSERKHAETMTESERRHEEAMAEFRRREEESRRREEDAIRTHEEAMKDISRRDEESRRRHDESMAALRELIERTG